jgi:hypothetical protein
MKTALCVLVLGLALALSPVAAHAATNPPISGQVSGIELCPKFICHVAIFAGVFQGQINFNPATGIVVTAMDHGELPTTIGGLTPIYFGGVWELRTQVGRFRGIVLGGSIVYEGNDRFHVTINLALLSGGTLVAEGTLDHGTLIPTFDVTMQ